LSNSRKQIDVIIQSDMQDKDKLKYIKEIEKGMTLLAEETVKSIKKLPSKEE